MPFTKYIIVVFAIGGLLAGCYTGAPTDANSNSGMEEVAVESDSADEESGTGSEGSQTFHVENFVNGQDLEFTVPDSWFFSQEDQYVTAASFALPNSGMAEAMPEGLKVDVLSFTPYFSAGSQTEPVLLQNGEWIQTSAPESIDSVVFFVSPSLTVAVAGSRTGTATLTSDDVLTIREIVNSIVVGGS